MGSPISQLLGDVVLTQEILRETKLDFVMEVGIASIGSLAIYVGFQEMQDFGNVFGIDMTWKVFNV